MSGSSFYHITVTISTRSEFARPCESTHQIDQVGHPLRGVHTYVVLLDSNTELLERLLSFVLHILRALHLLLPSLVQALHEFLTGLQLFLELRFGDSPDRTVLGLVRDLLL